jgi:non-canonical purine NTP pyrophosphatase (RdgB/HAM1 family)
MLARVPHTPSLSFDRCFGGLSLATSNESKKAEYRAIFAGHNISTVNLEIAAPIPDAAEQRLRHRLMAEGEYLKLAELVSAAKAEQAYYLNNCTPIVTEQTLLFIPHLSGWPGPDIVDLDSEQARKVLIAHAFQDRGAGDPGRVAILTSLTLYTPGKGAQHRHGFVDGKLAREPRGGSGFSWDRIVLPCIDGKLSTRTFAEMHMNEKNTCSMRYRAVLSLLSDPFSRQNDPIDVKCPREF